MDAIDTMRLSASNLFDLSLIGFDRAKIDRIRLCWHLEESVKLNYQIIISND